MAREVKTITQLIMVAVLALWLSACSRGEPEPVASKFSGIDVTGAPWGKELQLTDFNGEVRSLSDFKGRAVVAFFGYTNCPEMCPMTMHKLANAVDKLGTEGKRVQVVFVTLDPKRDTPAILKQYVPAFNPTFLGLYGDDATMEKLAKDFKVFYKHSKPDANGFYTVDHTGSTYAFDPDGRLRLFFSDQHSADVIAKDLHVLLKE